MASKFYTITAYTENLPGVLHRLTVNFTKRKINIESLCVSETHKKGISVFTIGVNVEETTITTIIKQIKRIIEVKEVYASEDRHLVFSEIAFIKVASLSAERKLDVEKLAYKNNCKVVYDESDNVIIEVTGSLEQINSIYNLFEAFGIIEFVRSGRIAMRKLASAGIADGEITA